MLKRYVKKQLTKHDYAYSCSYYVGGHYITIPPSKCQDFADILHNHLSCLGFIDDNPGRPSMSVIVLIAKKHLYNFEFHRDLWSDILCTL